MNHRHIFIAAKVTQAVYRIVLATVMTGALLNNVFRRKRK